MNLGFAGGGSAAPATPSVGPPLQQKGPGLGPLQFRQFWQTAATITQAPLPGKTGPFFYQTVGSEWLTLKQWADHFVHVMSPVVALPLLMSEADYERWAMAVIQDPVFLGLQLPEPRQSWKEWVDEVNQILNTVGAQ